MEHVVFFPTADGAAGFRRVPSLEEAVRLVEHLRNVEGVDGVSVHALTEVPLQFKAYYRVEVPTALDVPAQPVAHALEQDVPPLVDVAPLELVPEPVAEAVVEVAPEAEPVPALALVEEPVVPAVEPEPALASSNGHSKDGVASLGFFA